MQVIQDSTLQVQRSLRLRQTSNAFNLAWAESAHPKILQLAEDKSATHWAQWATVGSTVDNPILVSELPCFKTLLDNESTDHVGHWLNEWAMQFPTQVPLEKDEVAAPMYEAKHRCSEMGPVLAQVPLSCSWLLAFRGSGAQSAREASQDLLFQFTRSSARARVFRHLATLPCHNSEFGSKFLITRTQKSFKTNPKWYHLAFKKRPKW